MSGTAAELERSEAARAARTSVLAFATDSETESVLRDALADQAEGAEVRRGGLDEAGRVLRRSRSPHVLVIDISGNAQPLAALAELSQLVEPDVRVLAIGDTPDVSLYRSLTHGLGVLEYLFKPLTRELVRQHFGPVIDRESPGARLLRGGRVISVTGVHGGVGATTIAANLAWYLAECAHRHTLLLDGDLYGAAAAMLLSVKPRPGLRVALENPTRVDDLFIDRTAQIIGERLHVLSGEGVLADAPPIATGALPSLLEILRRRYKFLVCDAACPASRIGRGLLDLAHQRILITEPSVAGARDVLRYLSIPQASGLPTAALPGAPLVVLNQMGVKGSLSLAQFEQATGRRPDLVIPHLKGALRAAGNLGEPAAATRASVSQADAGSGVSRGVGGHGIRPLASALGPPVSDVPVFGRRQVDEFPPEVTHAGAVAQRVETPAAVPAPDSAGGLGSELRSLCLARLDPSVVAAMAPDRLAVEVERLVAEIATEQRIQLNAREQRRLSQDLVDDMLGLGPLEPLLEDDSVTDIMVNGFDRVFVERRGKVVRTNVHFRDRQHLINISQRVASKIGRRIDESSPMVDARLEDGSRVNIVFPPLGARRAVHVDPQVLAPADRHREAGGLRLALAAAWARAGDHGTRAAQHHHLRRHRLGQDDPAQRHLAHDRPRRAGGHDRGRGRTATAAAACRAAGDEAAQHREQGRSHPARPDPQRAAHATGPDHRGRGARLGGIRHAPGDEHGA